MTRPVLSVDVAVLEDVAVCRLGLSDSPVPLDVVKALRSDLALASVGRDALAALRSGFSADV